MPGESLIHPFPPAFDGESRILILGSFPSVKSREEGFYYGHPRNRFWQILADFAGEARPLTVEEKKRFLRCHRIALWDALASCTITGSSDASIRDAVANDLSRILDHAPIERILTNGAAASRIYRKYQQPLTGREAITLPSTSPANAAMSLSALEEVWFPAITLTHGG